MSKVNFKQYAGDLDATELVVRARHYDALSVQLSDSDSCYRRAHDTGVLVMKERDALQQRLAEAHTALQDIQHICNAMGYLIDIYKVADKALAMTGCADGEKAE